MQVELLTDTRVNVCVARKCASGASRLRKTLYQATYIAKPIHYRGVFWYYLACVRSALKRFVSACHYLRILVLYSKYKQLKKYIFIMYICMKDDATDLFIYYSDNK